MKILHIGKYYPPFYGGIERVNFDLVESLNRIPGYQVDELCFDHVSHRKGGVLPESVATGDVSHPETYYSLWRVPIQTIRFSTPISTRYFGVYRRLRKDYDIVHIHLPNPVASMALLMWPPHGRIILHWHSDIVKQRMLRLMYKPMQTLLLRRAERIIVTSEKYAEASVDLRPWREKVRVIPIGIDAAHLAFPEGADLAIRNACHGRKIVLSIGRLTYYKGFEYLIRAASFLGDDTVVLIGGCGELHDELEALIGSLGLADRVKLIGRIPQEFMGAYFSVADLFCLPSVVRTEAFGVVLVEALASGVPIVACEVPGSGVSWVNHNGVTGENVPVRNPKALAGAIRRLLDDPERLSACRKACLERYRNLFTREKMVDDVRKLYDEVYVRR